MNPSDINIVWDPRPSFNFTNNSFSLTDIITSKYFYIPAIFILSCYGVIYPNEIFLLLSTGVSLMSTTILELYNWWYNRDGGGPPDL